MIYLILVSILWSFSFGIIKYGLPGIDSTLISLMRNLIALLFFASLTLYNFKKFSFDIRLVLIGAIQFGLMYILYIQSYQYLPAYLIATFTITTPIFIGIFSQLLDDESFSLNGIFSIILVVIGSLMMRATHSKDLSLSRSCQRRSRRRDNLIWFDLQQISRSYE